MHRGSRSGRKVSAFLALCAVLLPCVLPARAAPPPSLSPSRQALESLAHLHQGRFDQASAGFRRISAGRPGDPEGPLFEALTAWWRLLDVPDDPELRPVLEDRLQEAIRRGEALLEGPEAQRGRLFAGTALLLAAQARAFSGSYIAAGKAARRGHDLLEKALMVDPRASDARFALGAYKYFAARLPWIVRLVRVFVRLPGGSVEEGLEALEDAAAGGEYFRAESLLLLAYIYSGDEEDDLRRSLEYLDRADRLEEGQSPLLAAIEARFLFLLGRLGEAEGAARRAVEMAAELDGVAPSIPALARLRTAQALYYRYLPAGASAALEQMEEDRHHLAPDAEERLEGLLARLQRDHAAAASGLAWADANGDDNGEDDVRLARAAPLPRHPGAGAALAALAAGRMEEAVELLAVAVEDSPGDPVSRYHLARALQMAGRHDEALAELERLFSMDARMRKTIRGWAMLRMGAALEATGRQDEAGRWYRRAQKLNGFVFYRAGRDRLLHPRIPFTPEG